MAIRVVAQEVVSTLNERSELGRVVVNSRDNMSLTLKDTEAFYFCCGRGFLTEASLQKHEAEVKRHTKRAVGNPSQVRRAIHGRTSPSYWGTRKTRSAHKMEEEEGKEVEKGGDDDNNGGQELDAGKEDGDPNGEVDDGDEVMDDGDGEEVEEDGNDVKKESLQERPSPRRKFMKRSRKLTMAKKRRGRITCSDCKQEIPATNIRRHIRVCHNPNNEFPCRYCSCRFEVAYGRMVHEIKNHRANETGPSHVRTSAIKVKKKLIHRPTAVSIPPKPKPTIIESPIVSEARNVIPDMSDEQKAACDSNIRKLGREGNDSKARFQCLICHKTFLGSRNAQDHMNSHYGLKPYKCPLCDFFFSFRSNVVRHVKTCHTENSEFICPYGCGCCLQSEASLKVHVNLVCTLRHNFQEKTMPKMIPIKQAAINPRPPPQSQSQDMKVFRQPQFQTASQPRQPPRLVNQALKDQYKHLEVSPGIYQCEQCQKTITGSGNFRDHLNVHANVRPHKCPKCYMRFTFKSNIKRHLNSAHVPNGQYACPMRCGCMMDNQHALQSHLNKCKVEMVKYRRSHAAGSPMKPKAPGPSISQIPQNQKTFAQQKPPQPLQPQRVLPRPPPLTPAPNFGRVSSSPSAGRPQPQTQSQAWSNQAMSQSASSAESSPATSATTKHQCKVCWKSVSCKRNLDNHMLIHLNIKPVKCTICSLRFRTLDTLKKHKMKSHGPNSPYLCSLCTCKFSQMQGLQMHINMFHKKKQPKQESLLKPEFKPEEVESEEQDQEQEQDYDDDDQIHNVGVEVEMQEGDEEFGLENDGEYGDGEDGGEDDFESVNRLQYAQPQGSKSTSNAVTPKIDLDQARTRDGNWKCHICGKILKKPLHLQNHMRIHSGEKPFRCQLCGHRFRLASTLYDHKKSSHRGGNYKCTMCTCTFETSLGLSRHKGIYHSTQNQSHQDYMQRKIRFIKEKAVKSVIFRPNAPSMQRNPTVKMLANRTSTQGIRQQGSESILKKRLETQQKQRQEIAKAAGASSAAKTMQGNGEVFQCGHCGLELPTINALSEHQLVHQTAKSPPKVQNQANTFAAEQQILSEAGPSPRNCPVCNQSIHGRVHYNKHMTGCHSGGPFRCDHCPCTFDSQGNLSRHFTLMHPGTRNSYTGVIAGGPTMASAAAASSTATATKINIKPSTSSVSASYEEHNEMSYEADEEEQGYGYEQEGEEDPSGNWDWNQQIESHQSQSTNDASLVDDSNVQFEMVGGAKRYICPDCGKSFDKMNRYKMHITVHSDVKPYVCDQCGIRFRLPGILATHVKKSHGSGQYHCQICPSRFTSAKGLSVHEFVYHKGGRNRGDQAGSTNASFDGTTIAVSSSKRSSLPNISKGNRVFSNSLSPRFIQPKPKQQPAPIIPVRPSLMTTAPKPVKLKCHLCYQIFFGTTALKEHMKEHRNDSEEQGQGQCYVSPNSTSQVYSQAQTQQQQIRRVAVNKTSPQTSIGNRQLQQQIRYAKPQQQGQYNGGYSGQSRQNYEEEPDRGFQIVGYDNGYANPDDQEQYLERNMDYGYGDGEQQGDGYEGQDEEYYGEDGENYDFAYAEDHLEIVHEENNFGVDEGTEDYGVEVEMQEVDEEEDASAVQWNQGDSQDGEEDYNGEEGQDGDGEQQEIPCKGCNQTFESRDAFAFHVENDTVSEAVRCPYCCTLGITVDSLPQHIDEFHPLDEIEFLESQIYSN